MELPRNGISFHDASLQRRVRIGQLGGGRGELEGGRGRSASGRSQSSEGKKQSRKKKKSHKELAAAPNKKHGFTQAPGNDNTYLGN